MDRNHSLNALHQGQKFFWDFFRPKILPFNEGGRCFPFFSFFFLHVHVIYFQCGFFKRVKPKDYEPTFQGEIKKSKDYDNVDYT